MPTAELLWTIQEERRREAEATAKERLIRPEARRAVSSIGRLVGWMRDRIRVFRHPTPGQIGWTSQG